MSYSYNFDKEKCWYKKVCPQYDQGCKSGCVRFMKMHFLANNALLSENKRIKGLDGNKMSKSLNNAIYLSDSKEEISKKIMGATTDSECLIKYDPLNKPGISNLINIATALSQYSIHDIENMFEGKNYGDFKRFVAEIVVQELSVIQEKYYQLIDSPELDKILDENIDIVRKIAKDKFLLMKKRMGMYR